MVSIGRPDLRAIVLVDVPGQEKPSLQKICLDRFTRGELSQVGSKARVRTIDCS